MDLYFIQNSINGYYLHHVNKIFQWINKKEGAALIPYRDALDWLEINAEAKMIQLQPSDNRPL